MSDMYGMQPGGYGAGGYGNEQSDYTQSRSAYGDIPPQRLYGHAFNGAGAATGLGNMFSDMGRYITPVTFVPPPRVMTGYSGRYIQEGGFFKSIKQMTGLTRDQNGVNASDFHYNASSDMGERLGLGIAGLGLSAAVTAGTAGLSMMVPKALGIVGNVAGGMAGFAALGTVSQGILDGVEARREIQNYVENTSASYVMAGSKLADPRAGAGFNRESRRGIAEMVRAMDVSDPTMEGEDLSRILKKSTEVGMFSGINDIKDFEKKFKDIVTNVKNVSRVLGQSLEEGVKTMRELKTIGFDPSVASSVVQQAAGIGLATGKSASEVLNLGLQGAEVFRGTGVDMTVGYQSNVMNLAAVKAAKDAGILSSQAIAHAGGEEALAQRMVVSSLSYAQSSHGRGLNAMYFDAARGGSGFDAQSFQQNMLSGGGDMMGNVSRAAGNMRSPGDMIRYEVNQDKALSEMGKLFGGQGLQMNQIMSATSEAKYLMSTVEGLGFDDAFKKVLMTSHGQSAAQANDTAALIKAAQESFKANQSGAIAASNKEIEQAGYRNSKFFALGAKIDDIFKDVYDTGAKPINKFVDSVMDGANAVDRVLRGINQVNVGDTGYEALMVSSSPEESRRIEKAAYLAKRGIVESASASIKADGSGEGDTWGSQTRRKVGGLEDLGNIDIRSDFATVSADQFLAAVDKQHAGAMDGKQSIFGTVQIDKDGAQVVMGRRLFSTETRGVSFNELDRINKLRTAAGMSMAEANELAGSESNKGANTQVAAAIKSLSMRGKMGEFGNMGDLGKEIFGVAAEDLTKDQVAVLRSQIAKSAPDLHAQAEDDYALSRAASGANDDVVIERLSQLKEKSEKARTRAVNELKDDKGNRIAGAKELTPEMVALFAQARERTQANDHEGSQALLAKAFDAAQNSGNKDLVRNFSQLSEAFLDKKGLVFEQAVDEFKAVGYHIGGLQNERYKGINDLVIRDAISKANLAPDVEGDVIQAAAKYQATSVEDLTKLADNEGDKKLLRNTPATTEMVQKAEAISKIQGMGGSATVDSVREVLTSSKAFTEKNIMDVTSGFVTGSTAGATSAIAQLNVGDTVGKTAMTGASEPKSDSASSTEILVKQTQINAEILMALKAVNVLMGSKRP